MRRLVSKFIPLGWGKSLSDGVGGAAVTQVGAGEA